MHTRGGEFGGIHTSDVTYKDINQSEGPERKRESPGHRLPREPEVLFSLRLRNSADRNYLRVGPRAHAQSRRVERDFKREGQGFALLREIEEDRSDRRPSIFRPRRKYFSFTEDAHLDFRFHRFIAGRKWRWICHTSMDSSRGM